MNELKVYRIDDSGGETFYVVAASPDAALDAYIECYGPEDEQSDVSEVPNDFVLEIALIDGYNENDGEIYPVPPRYEEKRGWIVTASISEWLSVSKPGEIISTTVW